MTAHPEETISSREQIIKNHVMSSKDIKDQLDRVKQRCEVEIDTVFDRTGMSPEEKRGVLLRLVLAAFRP